MTTKLKLWFNAFCFVGATVLLFNSCDKQNVPVIITAEVTEITHTTAVSGGNITDEGGATVTAMGVCWSTTQNPTINDSKTEDDNGAGMFISYITGLDPDTTYYVRAYATNSEGTGYGGTISFTTPEEVIGVVDADGKGYQTVTIGNQEWMAENLAYAPPSGNYWAYDNNIANVETHGYLYDWLTALNVCPTGWHLPSDAEWTELIDYLGENAGGKLKATGTIEAGTGLWHSPNIGATNETGFSALPDGVRYNSEVCFGIGNYGYWWSATDYNANFAWSRNLSRIYSSVSRNYSGKELGFSVRCLKDE